MTPTIPHDFDSEKIIVAICLGSGREAIEELSLITHTDGLFHDVRLAEVYRRIDRLYRAGKTINSSTVAKSKIEVDIPIEFLSELDDSWMPLSSLQSFLPGAIEARKRREALYAAQELTSKAQILTVPIDESIDQAEQSLFQSRFKSEQQGTIKDAINEAITDWETAHASGGKHTGIDSGFQDLDWHTWGFQPRNLIVIGARPSQGKTALLCNIAEHACVENKAPTLFFSLEMTRKEIIKRLICSMGRLNTWNLRAGQLEERDMAKMAVITGRINGAPLHILDRGSMSIAQMRSLARRYVSKHGIKLILVDYLQKARSVGKHEKRTYEVGEVSTGLKELAKECECPVVVAAQLNRESEKDKGRAPRASDLGDSGMIERDADIISLLYRRQDDEGVSAYQLLIVKHRDGPCGLVNLNFHKAFTRFESVAKVSEEDQPGKPYAD